MTTATEFSNIHALISQVLMDHADEPDPRRIAEVVTGRIPEDLRMQILINALVPQVKNIISKQRNTALSNMAEPAPAPPPATSFRPRGVLPAPASRPASIQVERLADSARPKQRSAKVEGIRDWWAELLASRIAVGANMMKPLGDCGVADLEYAENIRRDHAAREIAHAKLYLRLRMLLDEHHVATVAELPEHVARKAIA